MAFFYNRDKFEILRRIIKYIIQSITVAIACYWIPKTKLDQNEIIMISITSAAIFCILDMFSPSMGYKYEEFNNEE